MLLISHRYNTVRDADHVYVLDQGRIVEHGSHDQLLTAAGVYAELFTLQAATYTGAAQPNGHRGDSVAAGAPPAPGQQATT